MLKCSLNHLPCVNNMRNITDEHTDDEHECPNCICELTFDSGFNGRLKDNSEKHPN